MPSTSAGNRPEAASGNVHTAIARSSAGGRVANGTYLYMIRVRLGGEERTVTGTAVKLE